MTDNSSNNNSPSPDNDGPTKLVVVYEIMYGTPAEAGDPHAIAVDHRGARVHAFYDRTVEHVFSYPVDTDEKVYAGEKALRAATHKALHEKVKVGVDEPDYFIPLGAEVKEVSTR